MGIFVSELPKDCSECPMCRSGNLKLQKKGRYIEAKQCVFGQYKYQTIDDEIDTCPLKPLSVALAQERKKVVKEAKKLVVESTCYDTEEEARNHLYDLSASEVLELLDQIERGE